MTDWISVHVFYHGELDRLLVEAVAPLLGDLEREREVESSFFVRHWDGGPHLRLRLRPRGDRAELESLVSQRFRDYLGTSPAPDTDAVIHYHRYAPILARGEGTNDYLREPLPNNTVLAGAYVPETHRFGEGETLALVERHFAVSSRIALGLIVARANPHQRHTAALGATMLTWMAGNGKGTPKTLTTPELAALYKRQRETVRAMAGWMVEIATGTSALPATGALTRWWHSIRTVQNPRAADRCAHLLCNRLGLSLADEQQVRFLAARALAEQKPYT